VFIPKADLTIGSVLVDVLKTKVRSEAREVLQNESVDEVFSRISSVATKWVVKCEVSDSMVSGRWGLRTFAIDGRSHLYHQPDEGIEGEELLRIVDAWDPTEDFETFRLCLLNAYSEEWRACILPPAMGQWVSGPAEILLEAVSSALEDDPGYWGLVSERLRRGAFSLESLLEGTRDLVNLPVEVLESILGRYVTTTSTEGIQSERLTKQEARVLVAAFLCAIDTSRMFERN
jgi:hypothetical protein